jgi:hypothetical protein
MPTKSQVLTLYRDLLKSSRLFSSYNLREYVYHRTRQNFRDQSNVTDPIILQNLFDHGLSCLRISKRQGWINTNYAFDKLVIE